MIQLRSIHFSYILLSVRFSYDKIYPYAERVPFLLTTNAISNDI